MLNININVGCIVLYCIIIITHQYYLASLPSSLALPPAFIAPPNLLHQLPVDFDCIEMYCIFCDVIDYMKAFVYLVNTKW